MLFCVFVNPSFWVTVRPLISLFYFNTPPPPFFSVWVWGNYMTCWKVSECQTTKQFVASYRHIFDKIYWFFFFTFQYIIVRVRDRVWCERNKRRQRVVCNNTINALFVSLLYLNVFDIFRFKVFYWVFESYFLKKKKSHFAIKLET